MKLKINLLLFILMLNSVCTSWAFKSLPAVWKHELASTYLTNYQKGEHLIVSDIYTGTPGVDAIVKHALELKVSAWGKPFSATRESPDKKKKELLTVTLFELENPKEMRADFSHEVYENGKLFLKFSGSTILVREN